MTRIYVNTAYDTAQDSTPGQLAGGSQADGKGADRIYRLIDYILSWGPVSLVTQSGFVLAFLYCSLYLVN